MDKNGKLDEFLLLDFVERRITNIKNLVRIL